MTVYEAMNALECMGFSFRLDDNGEIKFRSLGNRGPEASALLEIARADRCAAADYVRQREAGALVVDDGCTYSVLDALAIAQAVKRGDAVLLAPVVFHVDPVNVSVYWKPVVGVAEGVLEWHREKLKSAILRRICSIEQQPIDGLSETEIDALYEQYRRYKNILEVSA